MPRELPRRRPRCGPSPAARRPDHRGRPGRRPPRHARRRPPAGPSPGRPGSATRTSRSHGNGGYDVGHYGLDLRYDPATRPLDGTAAILADRDPGAEPLRPRPARAEVTGPRSTVNGHRHAWQPRTGRSSSITPRRAAAQGRAVPRHGPLRRRTAGRSPTRTARSRAWCPPTTARSSPASRRARRPGSRPTTTRTDKATYDFTDHRAGRAAPRSPTAAAVAADHAAAGPPSDWREAEPMADLPGHGHRRASSRCKQYTAGRHPGVRRRRPARGGRGQAGH